MRRITKALALACCAAIAACSGGGSSGKPESATLQKGVFGQYYFVNVVKGALVGGTITSADGRINCGAATGATACGDLLGQTQYPWDSTVVLTATAIDGYNFVGWAGDCVGDRVSGNTCTVSNVVDVLAAAVFELPAPVPADPNAKGRVYGYVKDATSGLGAPGVSVSLGTATGKTNANGAYVIDIAAGAYQLATVASAQYDASTPLDVVVPVSGKCDAPAKQGKYAGAGCLVRQADIVVARAATYTAPAAKLAITTVPAMPAVVGFDAQVQVGCGVGGEVTQVSGPTALTFTVDAATGVATFTTPSVAAALAAVPVIRDGRPGFLSINQAQVGALTYKLQCALGGQTNTVNVPLVAAVNANLATAMRAEPFNVAPYKPAANGLPGVAGTLWAAGSQNKNFGAYTNCWTVDGSPPPAGTTCGPDGGPWRAHAAVVVPVGAVLILDGPIDATTGAPTLTNWKFCSAAADSYAGTCGTNTATTAFNAALKGNGTGYAWLVAPAGSTFLVGDTLSRVKNTFVGENNIQIQAKTWGGWDQRDVAGVESCAGCHLPPGEVIGTGPIDFICRNAGPTDPCYELGPIEPSEQYLESKHSKAAYLPAGGTYYSLQACGGCHTTGFDPSLPSTNNGFSTAIAGYQNDFLFEGDDATLFLADLKAKNPAAARLANVQCTSCHGPTPNSPNHTASLNAKVCGTCHNGHDPQYEQWSGSLHANLAGAIGEGPDHGRDQTTCARCHFAQGYFLYEEALKSGNPDALGNTPPTNAKDGAIVAPILCADSAPSTDPLKPNVCPTDQKGGLVTAQNVDAITCQTCHDPHSLEVRIKPADTAGEGMLVAGGFKVQNAGAGGLCAGCHNTRNGIVGAKAPSWQANTQGVAGVAMQHNDATPLTSNTTNNFGLGTPHGAAEADVYFQGNGYLLCNDGNASGPCTLTKPNYHRDPNFFADTCAECHVKRLSTATAGTPSNHKFTVDAGTCASCHGAGNELAMRKSLVANKLAAYQIALANVLNGAGITVAGTTTIAAGATITKAEVVSVSRAMGLKLTFSDGTVVSAGPDTIMAGAAPVLYATNAAGDKVYGKVVKSMYNWFLIDNDGSSGVHNMAFVDAMLDAMVNNLDSPGLPK